MTMKATKEQTQAEALQAIGRNAAESLAEMVRALECDYDRLTELRAERDAWEPPSVADLTDPAYQPAPAASWAEEFPGDAQELAELESQAGDCESREDAERRIQEDPLSVEVRSGWTQPGGEMEAEEFCLLLTTGGPAVRIMGTLNQYHEPDQAWIEVQDWWTPWTEYHGDAISREDLLTYCRQFYYGG
jgi:hypothetical protein